MRKIILSLVFISLVICNSTYGLYANSYISSKYKYTTLDKNKVTVLLYHHILPKEDMIGPWADNESVLALEDFESQMNFIYENNYNILTLETFKEYVYNDFFVPQNSILITFDDGYKSNFTYAYPILKIFDFNATIFLITSTLKNNTGEAFNPYKLQYANTEELKESSDIFSYGNHTYDFHHTESNGTPYMKSKTYKEVCDDIQKSSDMLQEYIDLETSAFAYPYGTYTNQSQQILRANNYKFAFLTTNTQTTHNTNPFYIGRYSISSQEDFECLFNDGNEIPLLSNAKVIAQEISEKAKLYNLSTDLLSDFPHVITRKETSELLIELYESITKKEAMPALSNPFKDTDNTAILKAYGLGIINGIGDKFLPEQPVTREQIATMLYRTVNILDNRLLSTYYSVFYADSSHISQWALNAVGAMDAMGVLSVFENVNNKIESKNTVSKIEALSCVIKAYEVLYNDH